MDHNFSDKLPLMQVGNNIFATTSSIQWFISGTLVSMGSFNRKVSITKLAVLGILIPMICMMMGTGQDESTSIRPNQSGGTGASSSFTIQPGDLNGSCRNGLGGFCVPVGLCSPEDKMSPEGTADTCDAGLECCAKELNQNLCASKGGECVAIGSCGEGIALFRGAEDCNRAKHGKDCCIWM